MKNRLFALVIVLVSIVFLCGCSSGPSEDTNVPDETLPNETQENVSKPSTLTSDDTCLSVIPIYSNAQFQADKQNDLESLVNTMATLSGVSGGKVAVYITPDGLESVIEFYQGHPPTGGYEKTLDLTSAEEGGIIVWEKGEMSAQMFSAIEEGQTVILLGCGPKLGSSAGPSLPVFTEENGLADDTITKIAVSPDGTVWAATTGGVSVYDGQNWTTFNTENGLPGDWIADLAIDANGNVWVTVSNSSYQGLARYDGASWQIFDPLNKAAPIAIAPDGAVWVGVCDVRDGGVYRFDGQEYTYFDEGFVGDVCVQDLFSTEDGSLWVATKSTIAQFDGSNWSVYTGEDGLVGEPITIFVDQSRLVWVGTDAGVSRFDGQTWTTYTPEDGLAGQEVNAITKASHGDLWFGTSNGVSQLKDGTWQSFTEDDGLPGKRVSSIAIAPDGRIWVGTTFDGVAIIEPEE